MGCDIHWILEQRHPDGAWHAVADKDLAYERFDATAPPISDDARWDARQADPLMRLGGRDYTLFGLLSRVRTQALPQGPLARAGFPADLSDYARAERDYWTTDWHTPGHLLPEDLAPADAAPETEEAWTAAVRRLPKGAPHPFPPTLAAWALSVRRVAALLDGAPVLLTRSVCPEEGERLRPEDDRSPETMRASAHLRLACARRGAEAKGGAWRLLIAYDN